MTTKLPGIPAIPANLDPQTKAYLKALTEVVLVRTGRIGDPLDRAVTLRELIESGLAESLKNNRFDPNEPTGHLYGLYEPTQLQSAPLDTL